MIKAGTGINPLSEFAEAARDELRTLTRDNALTRPPAGVWPLRVSLRRGALSARRNTIPVFFGERDLGGEDAQRFTQLAEKRAWVSA
jgi:hypothetical protein